MIKYPTRNPVFQVIKTCTTCCIKSIKGMTKYPTQKYKQLKLVKLAAVIAFSGFNKIIQADLRVPRNQKGGKSQ